MITDGDRAANRAAGVMHEAVVALCRRRRLLTSQVVEEIEGIVGYHTAAARAQGIRFPDMVVVVLPQAGGIEIVRRDLDDSNIQQLVRNLIAKYPRASAIEMAKAIRRAFPAYGRPGDLIEHLSGHAAAKRERAATVQ